MKEQIDWENLNIMITGGTGSFGKRFVKIMMRDFKPKKIIVFSRDELKQHEMKMGGFDDPSLRFFIGDVRDKNRLKRAMRKVDVVIHAAALKQVPSCEYNPFEAVKTNILGAQNIIDAAIDCGVQKVIALSTDKAVNPVNLYGATKLCSDKIFIQGNSYSGTQGTRFSCVRYGNVIGSRGSVIPLFYEQRQTGKVTITDKRMTRFWISLEQAVEFVVISLSHMQGGEIFVPKIPSMKIVDLAEAIAQGCEIEIIGIRPGEKLHEILITEEDGRNTIDYDGFYIILPQFSWWRRQNYRDAFQLPEGFSYTSNNNDRWLSLNELKNMAREFSAPIEMTGSPSSFQMNAPRTKHVIPKTNPRVTPSTKHLDVRNNIPI
ncbi:MAG: UDP-N-acetylglucosamine 4,6-dehydratase (inverting) [Desulfobacterales bacterium]